VDAWENKVGCIDDGHFEVAFTVPVILTAKHPDLGTRRERKEEGGEVISGAEYSSLINSSKNAVEGVGVVRCIPGGSDDTNFDKFDLRLY
jgi:hypothetical protein